MKLNRKPTKVGNEDTLKPIWDEKELYTGKGLTAALPTIILPSDPIALVERLDILMASKAAGNTDVRNELVSVCDELLRQKLIDKNKYKIIVAIIKILITKRSYKRNTLLEVPVSSAPSGTFFARMFLSNAAKQLASTALQAGKTAVKDIGMKAIDVGKTVAIDAGKKLVEKAAKRLTTSKSQLANVVVPEIANVLVPPEEIIKKVNEVIAKYDNTSAINLNKLIDGSSIERPNPAKAIAIQDLVKQINGSGLKIT